MFYQKRLVWAALLVSLPTIGSAAALSVNCNGTPVLSNAASVSCSYNYVSPVDPSFDYSDSASATPFSVSANVFGNLGFPGQASASTTGTVQITFSDAALTGQSGIFAPCIVEMDPNTSVLDLGGSFYGPDPFGFQDCEHSKPNPAGIPFVFGVAQQFSYTLSTSVGAKQQSAAASFGQYWAVLDSGGNLLDPTSYTTAISDVTSSPEPTNFMLGLAGLGAIGGLVKRRVAA